MTPAEIGVALQGDEALVALAKALAATSHISSIPSNVELVWLATPEPIRFDYIARARAIATLLETPTLPSPPARNARAKGKV